MRPLAKRLGRLERLNPGRPVFGSVTLREGESIDCAWLREHGVAMRPRLLVARDDGPLGAR